MTLQESLTQLRQAIAADDDAQAEALVLTLPPAAEPTLLAWLAEGPAALALDLHWWAARALAHCGGVTAIPALRALLNATDPTLRAVAAAALGDVYGRAPNTVTPQLSTLATLLADESGPVRQAAADALARCGEDAIPALTQIVQGDHQGARSRAVAALRKIHSIKAAPILFRCLNDPNYLVHTYAYEALDELGLLETALVAP